MVWDGVTLVVLPADVLGQPRIGASWENMSSVWKIETRPRCLSLVFGDRLHFIVSLTQKNYFEVVPFPSTISYTGTTPRDS